MHSAYSILLNAIVSSMNIHSAHSSRFCIPLYAKLQRNHVYCNHKLFLHCVNKQYLIPHLCLWKLKRHHFLHFAVIREYLHKRFGNVKLNMFESIIFVLFWKHFCMVTFLTGLYFSKIVCGIFSSKRMFVVTKSII